MKYGYVRAKSEEFTNAQVNFLQKKVDKIIIENNGDELKKLLEDLQPNDILFVYDLERLFRKKKDGKAILNVLLYKNVTLYIHDEKISLKNLAYAVGLITNFEDTDAPYEAILLEIELSDRYKLVNRIKT